MSHKPNMDLNTIFAAILIAGIIAMLASFVSRKITIPYFPAEEAFPIEVAEVSIGGAPAKPAGPDPILAMLSAADLEKGQSLAKQCAACHDFSQGGPNRIGPNLYGIVGAPKGFADGFAYSDALIEKGGEWTYQNLNHFLWKPKDYMPGTKMNYIGMRKPADRAALIAWMRTQGSNGYPLPTEAEIAAEIPEEPELPEAAIGDDVDGALSVEEAEELLIP